MKIIRIVNSLRFKVFFSETLSFKTCLKIPGDPGQLLKQVPWLTSRLTTTTHAMKYYY